MEKFVTAATKIQVCIRTASCKSKCFERERERSQNCQLPDVWGMISNVKASFSKDWMGNAAKSVTLWASRQNGLLMPWLTVAYALCTMLADHPDTKSVQTTRLCQRCEAKVKVTSLWQMAYWCSVILYTVTLWCGQNAYSTEKCNIYAKVCNDAFMLLNVLGGEMAYLCKSLQWAWPLINV